MSDDDELAREEAYIAKITAKKNQAFEKKVFGGGLEAARGTGSAKFGGGLEAARATSGTGGSGKFGGGLEAARAAAGLNHPGTTTPAPSGYQPVQSTPAAPKQAPELRGGLEAARAAVGLNHPGTTTPAPSGYQPVQPVPAPQPVAQPTWTPPPLQSEVIELTMDLPLPPVAKPASGTFGEAQRTPSAGSHSEPKRDDRGLVSDVDAAAAREEARLARVANVGASWTGGHSAAHTPVHQAAPVHHAAPVQQAPVKAAAPAAAPAPAVKPLQDWEKPPAQAQYGTKFENMLLAEILSARMNPQPLTQRKQHYNGNEYRNPQTNFVLGTQEGLRAVDDAINFLRTQPALGHNSRLTLEDGLSQSARDFCIIQKSLNPVENNEQANERLTRYGNFHGELLQNVAFCNVGAEELVLDWIIDDGNAAAGRPHRHAIFSSTVRSIGIASGPHQVGRVVCALFSEGYTPKGQTQAPAQTHAAPVHTATATAAPVDKLPDFVVGQLEQVDNNSANVLPITHLGCSKNDLSVSLRQNGNQVEFRRTITREGRLFNLPYQVTAATCSATYSAHENGGTLRIRLGKPVARPAAGSSEYEICQYTIRGNPSSTQPRVQIQVKQDNPDFYEFIPGLPSPWDTTFTVVVSDTNLMFKGTFSQPEGQTTKVINSTQTVALPLPPPPGQVETVDLPSGGKSVRVWHKPRPGQATASSQVNQPDCDVVIVAL